MKFEVGQKIKFESAELNNGEKEISFGKITHIEGDKIIGITEDWFEFEIEEKHIVEEELVWKPFPKSVIEKTNKMLDELNK